MCGIAGVYDRSGVGAGGPSLVAAMCRALAHRGPDSEGFYSDPAAVPRVCLGVRRLAIVDLETGDQPLFNEDRSVVVVFNGQIANHVELRADLVGRGHRFRSGNDGETLVHLYEERGLELFAALRGMYAFALWDASRDRLLLAVDHVGIKPLYIADRSGRLRFASDARALLCDPTLPRRLALPAVDTYLTFGSMFGSETLIEGVRRLPPGHVMVVEGGTSRLQRHFTLGYPPLAHRPSDPEAIIDETRARFTEAVRLHLRSDAPLGLFLSGGIDSSAILAAMHQATGSPVTTFTVGYDPSDGRPSASDESAAAQRVAAHFSTDHHELRLSADEWWTTLGEYAGAGEAIANPSMVTLFALARLASRHVKVALNGTGGDELFAGYRGHRVHPRLLRVGGIAEQLVPSSLRHVATGPLWQRLEPFLPAFRRRRVVGALPPLLCELRATLLSRSESLRRLASFDGWTFSDTLRRELYSPELGDAWTDVRHAEGAFAEVLAAATADDPADLVHALTIAGWLPANGLLALDGVTMAHGLEARVPFFDPPLLGYAASLPPRIRGRGEKWLLREAMRRDLPSFAVDRPKQAFETPLGRWFDRDLGSRLQEVLLDPVSLGRGIFRAEVVERMLGRHLRGEVDHTELIFRLVVLELWQTAVLDGRRFLDHAPNDDRT